MSQTVKIEETQQPSFSLSLVVYVSLGIFIGYSYMKLKSARKRKVKGYNSIKHIEPEKIIIAIEIKDFVVKYSQKAAYGYLPLDVSVQLSKWQQIKRKITGEGSYYKAIFPVNKIKQFMYGLATMPKVSLLLYTSLQPAVAQAILYKLGLQKYFPVDMRKYCDLQNHDDQKHAIQVDRDSRRVIIVTPTHEDHRLQDQKYFLIVRPKVEQSNFLKNWAKDLKTFIESNQNINDLHDELADFKVNYDSEQSQTQIE